MSGLESVGFRKSVYYTLNTLPLVKHVKTSQTGVLSWANNKLFGFTGQAQRLEFLSKVKPEQLSLSGAFFGNFMIAVLGAAIFLLGARIKQSPIGNPKGAHHLGMLLQLDGGLTGLVSVNNFIERAIIPKAFSQISAADSQKPLRLVRGSLAIGVAGLSIAVGNNLAEAGGSFALSKLGVYILAVGTTYLLTQIPRIGPNSFDVLSGRPDLPKH
ncbi:MAG TPA: hypothetical protein VMT55_06310 [Candidatus Sulfotelmatobacter sp.]|nr:hypothetical protein [Candidatus Sulfotelmatobacter sp.]